MRLAVKLCSSLVLTTLVVLAISSALDRRRRDALLLMDLDEDLRAARAVRVLATAVSEAGGEAAARHMIQTADEKLPRNFRWLALDEVPVIEGRDLRAEVAAHMTSGDAVWVVRRDERGDVLRYMYVPIAPREQPVAVIELSESLAPRLAYFRHHQIQTAGVGIVVLLLSATLAAVLGHRMVRRPVETITAGVRALGEGRFGELLALHRRDEFGDLASELNALGARLAARERIRHADRLRTVGHLASGVAHELGTPLSVIGVRARMIALGEVTGPDARSNAQVILDQSDRMTRIVRQLLDYSRRQGTNPVELDLRQTVAQSVDILAPLAREHGVTITTDTPPESLVVSCDAGQLQQVLTNLMLNAVQAMPSGGRIEVTAGHGRAAPPTDHGGAAGDYGWVSVADDGPGIAAADLPRVFEPFFTTKSAGEGTGLGLPVAQAIVDEYGGWIAVESEPRRGARFTVYLPLARQAQAERRAS